MADKPDHLEKGIRLGCGSVFGALIGVYLCMRLGVLFFGVAIAVILAVAVISVSVMVCGQLATKLGDRFWHTVPEWLHFLPFV